MSRYCIVRHCAFLVGRGHSSGDPSVAVQSYAEATKLAPAIRSAFEEREIVPTYMKNIKGALALWNVKARALTAQDRERAKQGTLGPPKASDFRQTL